jgi:hypothetical protein
MTYSLRPSRPRARALGLGFASALAASLLTAPVDSAAQSTAGIFSPVINEGHMSAQYRIGYDPDAGGWAQRVHFQHAPTGSFMWRAIAQIRDVPQSDLEFHWVQGELYFQLSDDEAAWQTGLRVDGRVFTDLDAGALGLHWMNEFRPSERTEVRLIAMSSIVLGEGSLSGVLLQGRGYAYYQFVPRFKLGAEMYSVFGTTGDLPSLVDQFHQLGPVARGSLGGGWSAVAGVLFGLTDRPADYDLRFWLTKSF